MTARASDNRSYLVVAGDDRDAVTESVDSPADAVLLDLEDGVAPADKKRARRRTVTALDERFSAGEQYTTVRVNGLDTEWGVSDVRTLATASAPPDSVCLPKVRGPAELRLVAELLSTLDSPVAVVAIVESAAAVFDAYDIAHATPRLDALIFGSVDFRRSVGMPASVSGDGPVDAATQKLVPRTLVSMAASTAGIAAVDGGYYVVDDREGVREDARTARSLGFDGKAASTPEQVSTINDALGPSDRELAEARKVVRAFEEAGDVARLELDGAVLERSHLERGKATLRRAGEDLEE